MNSARSLSGRSTSRAWSGFVRLVVLVALTLCGGCGGNSERPGTPPKHVLLLTCAGLRADHMSAYLYPRTTTRIESTPDQRERGENLALDDLAEQGVLYWNAYSPRAAAGPALASLLCGRNALELGVLSDGEPLPAQAETLAERFQAAGFRTAAFVADAALAAGNGFEQGFKTYETTSVADADPDYAIVKAALAWLREQGPADPRPLFVWLHFSGPEVSWEPQPLGNVDYAALFADPDYAGSANGSREWLSAAATSDPAPTPQDLERIVALYDGEIARMNWLVRLFLQVWAGRFPDQQPRDLLRDSALVFAGTHGQELYQRNRWFAAERSVWSSSLRVPLLLRHPGSLTGARVFDAPVELADIAPTLCDWFELANSAAANSAPPDSTLADSPGNAARSLLALTDSHPRMAWVERPALGGWRDSIRTACDGRWRLVANPNGVDPSGTGAYPVPSLALYDLEADPLERTDVAANHPDVVERLSAALAVRR
jgi:arylsulfatase A-like enzyme